MPPPPCTEHPTGARRAPHRLPIAAGFHCLGRAGCRGACGRRRQRGGGGGSSGGMHAAFARGAAAVACRARRSRCAARTRVVLAAQRPSQEAAVAARELAPPARVREARARGRRGRSGELRAPAPRAPLPRAHGARAGRDGRASLWYILPDANPTPLPGARGLLRGRPAGCRRR